MSAPPPPELKFIGPYLQRAQELQQREPVISYYCTFPLEPHRLHYWQGKFYAAKMALQQGVNKTNKEATAFLTQLLDQLEQVSLEGLGWLSF